MKDRFIVEDSYWIEHDPEFYIKVIRPLDRIVELSQEIEAIEPGYIKGVVDNG